MNESNTLQPLIVQLNKLFLWVEAERPYLYPQYLSANVLDFNALYTERDVYTEVFELLLVPRKGEPGSLQARRKSLVSNVFGLEVRSPDAIRLRGINLFIRVVQEDNGTPIYRLSPDGCRLVEAYRPDPEGDAWLAILAQILTKYEPRTRTLFYYLGHLGYRLQFADTDSAETSFFSYPAVNAQLVSPDDKVEPLPVLRPVKLKEGEVPPINAMMRQRLSLAIGSHWRQLIEEAGIVTARPWLLRGSLHAEPSDNDINRSLKCSLTVFRDLGILRFEAGAWTVDAHQAWRHLGADVCNDLLPEAGAVDFWAVLERHYRALLNEDRVVQVALLYNHVAQDQDLSEAEFDRQVRQLIYEGRLRLGRSWRGQQRHGRGLFGEVDKQFVEFIFT